jgi:hypothetical protein
MGAASRLEFEHDVTDLLASLARSRRLMIDKLAALRKRGHIEHGTVELTLFENIDNENELAPTAPAPFVVSGHVEATLSTSEVLLWWLEIKRAGTGWSIERGLTLDNEKCKILDSVTASDSTSLAAQLASLVAELLSIEPDVIVV